MSEWFVASNGATGNAGTINAPWDLASAASGHSGSVVAGDTVWLLGAGHNGSAQTYSVSNLTISTIGSVGTGIDNRDGKIVFRNYNNERVTLDTGSDATVSCIILGASSAYTWIWGLELMNSKTNPADLDSGGGVNQAGGNGNKVINCLIHDHGGNAIGAFIAATNFEAYGNVLWFNGKTPGTGNYDYHFYWQNDAPSWKKAIDNILFHCYGNYPMHFYGSNLSALDNFTVRGNAGTNYTTAGNWWLFGGGVPLVDSIIDSNYGYSTSSFDGILDLGYQIETNGSQGCQLTNNYWMKGKPSITNETNLTNQGNIFYGELHQFTSVEYPTNTYYEASWPTEAPSPNQQYVIVRPNTYEAGRGHIVIYTFNDANTANVNLSTILNVNDSYEIRDAQNYYGTPIASGTYTGGSVSLSVTGTTIASPTFVPAGRSTPVHTSKEFNAWVVIRTTQAAQSTIRLAYRLS